MPTELEESLYWQIVEAMLPEPEREQIFIKGRKFRADFLCEVQTASNCRGERWNLPAPGPQYW